MTHDAQSETPSTLIRRIKPAGSDIVLSGLSVRTPGESGRILADNINLTLERGKRYVLTGKSGSGKTITAKALLGQWDDCAGVIELPSGMKMMSLSQQSYFPDTDLRSILNMKPEGKHLFKDEDLSAALQKVGLENLIQHIPGETFRLMFEDIKDKLPSLIKNSADAQTLKHEMLAHITDYMGRHSDTVQFIPEANKQAFKAAIAPLLDGFIPAQQSDEFLDDILTQTERKSLAPLTGVILKQIPEYALKHSGLIWARSAESKRRFAAKLEKQLKAKLSDYLHNRDTDDLHRKPGINEHQADYLAKQLAESMLAELGKLHNSRLSTAFNRVCGPAVVNSIRRIFSIQQVPVVLSPVTAEYVHTLIWPLTAALKLTIWPLQTLRLYKQSKQTAADIVQATTLLLQKQALKGSDITYGTRLSGGQKQKLNMAIAHLHQCDFLITDEITANLDEETGDILYRELMQSLPADTTVLSIAHNKYVRKHHTHHLTLENQKISMQPIAPDEQYQPG